MATKKQKREQGEALARIQREESIRTGLLAQQKDHEARERKRQDLLRWSKKVDNTKAMRSLGEHAQAAGEALRGFNTQMEHSDA